MQKLNLWLPEWPCQISPTLDQAEEKVHFSRPTKRSGTIGEVIGQQTHPLAAVGIVQLTNGAEPETAVEPQRTSSTPEWEEG